MDNRTLTNNKLNSSALAPNEVEGSLLDVVCSNYKAKHLTEKSQLWKKATAWESWTWRDIG